MLRMRRVASQAVYGVRRMPPARQMASAAPTPRSDTKPPMRQPLSKPNAPQRWARDIDGRPNPGVGNVLISVSLDLIACCGWMLVAPLTHYD